MAFKSIDLQISLPRTAEMSPLAGHQQHRPMTEQAMLAQQAVKNTEQMGQRLLKSESSSKGEIADRQHRGGGQQSSQGRKRSGKTAPEQENRPEHPFKGKHIDFIG